MPLKFRKRLTFEPFALNITERGLRSIAIGKKWKVGDETVGFTRNLTSGKSTTDLLFGWKWESGPKRRKKGPRLAEDEHPAKSQAAALGIAALPVLAVIAYVVDAILRAAGR